jgi:hypothetical protein
MFFLFGIFLIVNFLPLKKSLKAYLRFWVFISVERFRYLQFLFKKDKRAKIYKKNSEKCTVITFSFFLHNFFNSAILSSVMFL